MKKRFFSGVAAFLLIANVAGSLVADVNPKTVKRAKANQLVALLPQSDAVVTVDVKRFFDSALPTVLASDPRLLGEIIAKVDKLKEKSGIDVRQFENIAAGIAIKKVKEKEFDYDPAIIARGQVDSGALIDSAKKAADGKYKEERVGAKAMFVFAAKEIAGQHLPQAATGKKAEIIDRLFGRMSHEIAVSALDVNTIVFGDPARVRETIEAKTKVTVELTSLLNRKEYAVVNFAGKVPSGMSMLLPLDNDELGKNIDSIRNVFGYLDVAEGAAVFNVTAKTMQPAQAQGLHETLEGLQILGKMLLGSSKRPDQQLYARLIENVKFTRTGSEVTVDLKIPQTDIDALLAVLK
jgi:hypothetical protein